VLRVVSAAFGVLMVATAGAPQQGPALVAGLLAGAAVAVGILVRPVAVVAVALTVATVMLADPPPVMAALSGLSAVGYLLVRHATDSPATGVTAPTVAGALGFSVLGLAAASIPLQVVWLPLVAPLAVVAIYVLVTQPFSPRSR
jgi:hypothetical protein